MTTKERSTMLERFEATNRWLTRVYDTKRSDEHRVAMWDFLMKASDDKLKHLLIKTRALDEQCVEVWDEFRN